MNHCHLFLHRTFCAVLCAMLLVLIAPASAEIDQLMEEQGWEEITFDDYIPNDWSATGEGVQVRSDGSVSIIYRPVQAQLADMPVLRWRWRSDTPSTPSDLTVDEGEDRILSLIVAFPYEPKRATFSESLFRKLAVAMRGPEVPGRTLSYVWGGDKPRGSLVQNRRRRNVSATRILRTADDAVDVWHEEAIDITADFREIFGWSPPNPTHIGLSADSDDSGVPFTAEAAEIRFTSGPLE